MKSKKPSIRLPKVEILPSGAAHTRVLINGQRVSITKDTPEECVAEYLALKHKVIETEKKEKHKETTLEDALEKYIGRREGKTSPATIRGYKIYKKHRLLDMMKRNVYTTTDDQWQRAVDLDFRGLTNKYARNVWSFYASAIEEETGRRPSVEIAPPKKTERPYLEPDQVLTFVEAVKGCKVEIAALMELSSLRISEVLAVRGADVDMDNGRIRVHGAAVPNSDNKMVYKDENKTETSERYVPLIPPLREALEGVELTDDYLVKMSPSAIFNAINRVCDGAGLPRVGNHGLRHSFASLAYHLDMPEKIAMEIGGWKDSKVMHDIYTHLAQKDIANRAKQFSDFFIIGNEAGNENEKET